MSGKYKKVLLAYVPNAIARLLHNGIKALIWKLSCHWLNGLRLSLGTRVYMCVE